MTRGSFLGALYPVKVEGRLEKQELEAAEVFGMWLVAYCSWKRCELKP